MGTSIAGVARSGAMVAILLSGPAWAAETAALLAGPTAGPAPTASMAAAPVEAPAGAAAAPAAPADAAAQRQRSPYWVPALEIFGFDFLLNRVNRRFSSTPEDYRVSTGTIRRNLHSSWTVDSDPFRTNQLGHPYQGAMYHQFGRSAGLDYWQSLGLAFLGSAGWEIAGESTRPSRNDQIASGIGGTFLGEPLYRMANLLLEHGGETPARWRELGAAVISPANAFNRHVYGHGMGLVFDSRRPAYYSRLQVGVMGATQNEPGLATAPRRNEAQVDFLLDYGLPGKEGYVYRRPFDYFAFRTTLSSANGFSNVMSRGMLAGRDYELGKNYRGIWGLYGTYDYVAPQTFRISTSALSLGTTGQWRAGDGIVIQGSALAGLGYAAVGSVNGAADRDYHYGVAPQALLALRLIKGDRASLDFTGREYFVSKVGANPGGPGGHDSITRADVALTFRLTGLHAVTFKYLWNRRSATSQALGDRSQTRGTVGIFYTLLGQDRFGAVDWR
ncbi:DUF3943 domain-containing protein [Ramlibacter sp.]|uniref:DUF3943 domain-containing protein n=1 Tax=Ramlibacter sp. TaxID=1917967 RepID=UPI002C1931DA|nr:DUF3943 domain-containing protein [Ramlibacter sp.]HWI80532.1 DUF3943 domain-containing protein [Ramlibacter sp.]